MSSTALGQSSQIFKAIIIPLVRSSHVLFTNVHNKIICNNGMTIFDGKVKIEC